MSKFAEIAKRANSASPIIAGHEKIKLDDLVVAYPNGVTVTEFDIIAKSNGDAYAVMRFAEDPTRYFNAGSIGTKIAMEWANACGGDIAAASAELCESGGVKFRITKCTTKAGRTINRFDIIE